MIYVKSVFDIKYLGGGYNLKETLDLIMYTLFLNALLKNMILKFLNMVILSRVFLNQFGR